MHQDKKTLLIVACAGVLGAFLPWYGVLDFALPGVALGKGFLSLILFAVASSFALHTREAPLCFEDKVCCFILGIASSVVVYTSLAETHALLSRIAKGPVEPASLVLLMRGGLYLVFAGTVALFLIPFLSKSTNAAQHSARSVV